MEEKNISAFKSDIFSNNGYIYTNTDRLSCKLSASRYNQAIYKLLGSVKGKKVIDIGCGDGAFTKEIIVMEPESIVGVDPNGAAIQLAKKNFSGIKNISFEVMDVYNLPLHKHYDLAILRGVLHHLYHVEKAIERICKITDKLIVLEPNGYNFILKLFENFSTYHIRHEEHSFFPKKLDKWFISQGGFISKSFYICLVPMFCPDFIAKILKYLEPWIERIPVLRNLLCGGYIQEIQIKKSYNVK